LLVHVCASVANSSKHDEEPTKAFTRRLTAAGELDR